MFVPAVCVPVRLPARSKRPNRLEALRKQCFFFCPDSCKKHLCFPLSSDIINSIVAIHRAGSYGGVILIRIFVQYLFMPIPFLLTFVVPILFFLISRKYAWFSIPLTALVELLVNWRNFTYYESRGLMILVTLFQLAIMAVVIILLRSAFTKKKT